MRAALPIILALMLCRPAVAAGCDCLWQGSFATVQGHADLVVAGEVVAARGNSIDLRVERKLRGDHARETLRIWLKTRDYCRPEAQQFPVGGRWVMALYEITEQVPGGFNPHTPNLSYGRIGDYRLSSCGGFWLRLSGDMVTGNLVDAPRWDRQPKMNPVLLDLVARYVQGQVDKSALKEAARPDPALRELILDTREFLREQD